MKITPNYMKSKEKLKKDGWVPITGWSPRKITYQLNEEIETLINFIEEKKEAFDHETDDVTKPFVIKILPVGDIGSAIQDFEVQKFLVSLLRQKIISDLYLPVYIRKKNQETIRVHSDVDTLYLDKDLALSHSLNKPEEFRKHIIQFRIINWNKFIKLKDKIEKSKEYKKYKKEKKLKNKLAEIEIIKEKGEKFQQKSKGEIKKTVLYLNQFGELYREPKEKYCYPMAEKKDRHKIVQYLVENRGYQPTVKISSTLEGKNEKSIRTEIGHINSIAKGKLHIKDNFIQGKKESGYRINPKYKIILKNE